MKKEKSKLKGEAPIQKLAVGEKIEFARYVISKPIETRFGEGTIVAFANDEKKIFRKAWAQGGMLEHLKQNPGATSLCLKDKLVDGELTYNVWE